MKIMIAQTPEGKDYDTLRTEWFAAADAVTGAGDIPVNSFNATPPANADASMYGLSWKLLTLSESDGVYFVPGWEGDRELILLYIAAPLYGKRVFGDIRK